MSGNLDIKALLGKEMTVHIQLDELGDEERQISGLVTSAHFLHQDEGRHSVYQLTLRPWLYLLTKNQDCQIYQDNNVVGILDQVLQRYPYPVERRLDVQKYQVVSDSPNNEPRWFQVQYNESDYSFINRLMQEYGIYYYFEHQDSVHRLVLADQGGAHRLPASGYRQLSYHPTKGYVDQEYLHKVTVSETLCSGQYEHNDYDPMRSRADLTIKQALP
ncbi:phage late control D family protein, partial [Neisseriaceae bacterium TC5R-5]|nr:phage late control D family protein [Neisseriaceae bacterium TC5R-5]